MADYTLTAKLTANAKDFISGFGKAEQKLANLQGKTAAFGSKFQSLGKSISSMGDKLTSKITKPAAAATGALVGVTLVKGFNRLTGIDTARAKLIGLGHDADSVETIMTSALDSVKGTSYGLDEAATTAASAVAAGIKPGKELTRYLSLTGDAAAIAGTNLSEMGPIFNKVQTSNKAYNSELQQLSERGLPIYQWLAEEAGVTEDAVFDMASNGAISSEMFLNAVENNIGGAAKKMGEESFMAGLANIGAAVGRLGASFLDAGGEAGGFFSAIKPMISDTIGFIDGLADKAEDMGVKFGNAFIGMVDKIGQLKSWFDDLSPSVQNLITKGAAIGAAFLVGLGPVLKIVGGLTTAFGGVATAISFLLNPVALVVAAIAGLGVAFGVAWAKSETFREIVMNVFERIQEIVSNVVEFLTPILSTLWDGAQEAIGEFGSVFMDVMGTLFEIGQEVFGGIVEILTSVVDGFQGAGGEVNMLKAIFMGLNPVASIAKEVLVSFGPQLAEGFSQIASMVIPLLTQLGTMLGELAAAILPALMNVFSTLIPVIVNVGMAIAEIVMAVLPTLIDIVMQLVPVITQIVSIAAQIITQVVEMAGVLINAILPVIMTLIDTIMNIVEAVAPALIAILQAVILVFEAIIPVVTAVLSTVVDVVAGIISAINPIIAFVGGIISTIMSIISPIVSFIAGIITSIFSVIQPITSFASGVFSTVGSIITGTFQMAMSFISSAISTISGVISTLSGVVSGVFNTISGIVSSVMNGVSSTITGVFSAIEGAWNGLTGMVSNIFSGISSSVETLVNQVKGFVNGVIGGINAAVGLINKIPGVSISKIPQLYRGTDDWGGGFAYMNEGGRGELAMLPGGTQVIPHDVSMRYAREAGRQQGGIYQGVAEENINNENNITIHASIRDDRDIDKLAIKLDEKLENLGSRRRAALGG